MDRIVTADKSSIALADLEDALSKYRDATLSFNIEGTELSAPVTSVSEHSIKLRVADTDAKTLRVGQVVTHGQLMSSAYQGVLAQLIIQGVSLDDASACTVVLHGENEETRTSIWSFYHDLKVRQNRSEKAFPPERLPSIPGRGVYTEDARLERLGFVRQATGLELDTIARTALKAEKLTGNIENLVGGVEIPVGLGGPLWFNGENVRGPIIAPFATTEGALVASVTRGAIAISRSGGVTTRVLRKRMFRVPLFVLNSAESASKFRAWVLDHKEQISAQIGLVSRHAKLVEISPDQVGDRVNVTFGYETGDAAGQNMTTLCTWKACQWIIDQMKNVPGVAFENFLVEGNRSGDKKVNYQSFLNGRGTRVTAEAMITHEVLERVLKVGARQLEDGYHTAVMAGIQIGMIGINMNIANVIGAMFTALGQDIACVHESSLGSLRLHATDAGVYLALDLPALIVGTVGGGTSLPQQADYLEMIGCKGARRASRLAEIVAGFCLALDLSTGSAMASGQFTAAHNRLGRNRPVQYLTPKDLRKELLTKSMQSCIGRPDVTVKAIAPVDGTVQPSYFARDISSGQKLMGLFPLQVEAEQADGTTSSARVMVHVLPLDTELIQASNKLAQMCGGHLAPRYDQFKHLMGWKDAHVRELAVYAQEDKPFKAYLPALYDVQADPKREAFILVTEDTNLLEQVENSENIRGWSEPQIRATLKGLAELHSVWLGREEELLKQPWIGSARTTETMVEMKSLWQALGNHARSEFPNWFADSDLDRFNAIIRELGTWYPELESMPRTLIHNDLNNASITFRRLENGEVTPCFSNWGLATLHLPQRDVVEFLVFSLSESVSAQTFFECIEYHRAHLQTVSGIALDPKTWLVGYVLAMRDFIISKMSLYLMGHTFKQYDFVEHACRMIRLIREFLQVELGLNS